MLTGASLVQRPPEPWPARGVPVKSLAGLLFGTGALFGFLWLAEILPAMVHGGTPASIAAAALPVNPVHVMDLAAILPAYIAAAALLLQRRRLGEAVATILLAFGFLMAASIARHDARDAAARRARQLRGDRRIDGAGPRQRPAAGARGARDRRTAAVAWATARARFSRLPGEASAPPRVLLRRFLHRRA